MNYYNLLNEWNTLCFVHEKQKTRTSWKKVKSQRKEAVSDHFNFVVSIDFLSLFFHMTRYKLDYFHLVKRRLYNSIRVCHFFSLSLSSIWPSRTCNVLVLVSSWFFAFSPPVRPESIVLCTVWNNNNGVNIMINFGIIFLTSQQQKHQFEQQPPTKNVFLIPFYIMNDDMFYMKIKIFIIFFFKKNKAEEKLPHWSSIDELQLCASNFGELNWLPKKNDESLISFLNFTWNFYAGFFKNLLNELNLILVNCVY